MQLHVAKEFPRFVKRQSAGTGCVEGSVDFFWNPVRLRRVLTLYNSKSWKSYVLVELMTMVSSAPKDSQCELEALGLLMPKQVTAAPAVTTVGLHLCFCRA